MWKMAVELESALVGKILMLTLTKCQRAEIIELMTIIKATSCGSWKLYRSSALGLPKYVPGLSVHACMQT